MNEWICDVLRICHCHKLSNSPKLENEFERRKAYYIDAIDELSINVK